MAINPLLKYVGRITAATLNYPFGSSKNETSPGAGDGTPYELARADDIFGFQQALLEAAQITPSNNSETALVSEYLQAIVEVASGRAFNYDESGAADAYVLDLQTNQQGPRSYFDGMVCKFFPGNTNTGASTVNVNALGVTAIKLVGGVADPSAGALTAGSEITLIYRSTPSAHLELQTSLGGFASGSYTTASLAQNGVDERDVSHGLGTDNIDMGFSLVGSDASSVNRTLMHGIAQRPDGQFIQMSAGILLPTPAATLPSSGDMRINVEQEAALSQTITVYWWARAR